MHPDGKVRETLYGSVRSPSSEFISWPLTQLIRQAPLYSRYFYSLLGVLLQ